MLELNLFIFVIYFCKIIGLYFICIFSHSESLKRICLNVWPVNIWRENQNVVTKFLYK